jgi:thiol-disulfide isomerase/thioredoxin
VEQNVLYSDTQVGVVVLGVFQDKTSKNYEAFKEANFGRTYPKFIWVKDASLAAKYLGEEKAMALAGSKEDAVFVVTKFTDDPEGPIYQLPTESLGDTDAIVRWMDIRSAPLVWRYSDGLSSLITTGKLQKFLWAFVDSKSPYWTQWEKALTQVAIEQRGQMKFVLVSEAGAGLMQFFRIDPATLPQGLIIDIHPEVGQRQFKVGEWDAKARRWDTDMAKDVTPAKLSEFLEKYRSGKIKRYLRSEPIPKPGEEYENEVLKVVGDTFEETIGSGKDVLMNFYGDFSWCEHCKMYAPEWDLIAKTFKPVTSLVVAKIDFPLNDIEDNKKRGMDITGFPDVLLFRAGEHTLPPIRFNASIYNEERGLKAVLQFIKVRHFFVWFFFRMRSVVSRLCSDLTR